MDETMTHSNGFTPLQVGQLQGVARSGAEAHVKLSRLFQQIMLRP